MKQRLFNPFDSSNGFSVKPKDSVGLAKTLLGKQGRKVAQSINRNQRILHVPPDPAPDFAYHDQEQAHASREGARQAFLHELYQQERELLGEFFGESQELIPLPEYVTPEQVAWWHEHNFDVHFLPRVRIHKDLSAPGWIQKPGHDFYSAIEYRKLFEHAQILPGRWVLVDKRPVPTYDHQYEKDIFAKTLTQLNTEKKIEQRDTNGTHLPPYTRFGLCFLELQDPEVIDALRACLHIDHLPQAHLRLPRFIERNVLGNVHNLISTWTDFYAKNEFLGDIPNVGPYIFISSGLALSDIEACNNHEYARSGYTGFRPIVVFY